MEQIAILKKYVTTINFRALKFKQKTYQFRFLHNMYVIKAIAHGCVQNDSETHSTGVTGRAIQ